MNSVRTYVVCLVFIVATSRCSSQQNNFHNSEENEAAFLDVRERAEKHGYLSSKHVVETEDGYLLALFRIRRYEETKGPPVLLMHGLLQSASMWLDAKPGEALAYLLAEAGQDIWLGNDRGTHYSRRHAWLNPDTDPQFWQFSADEIGRYDLPAYIDYIRNTTSAPKINYIGFSHGGGVFFIMCSERPEYRDKVNGMIGISPSSRHLHTKSLVFRLLGEYFLSNEGVLSENGNWEVFAKGSVMQLFIQSFCAIPDGLTDLCESIINFVDAINSKSRDKSSIRNALADFPSGTSVRSIARYGQMVKSTEVRKFDHGRKQNLMVYGSETPPAYNFSSVTVPTVIIYGNNDGLVDRRDVKWLVTKLGNVLEVFEIMDPHWSHMDVQISTNISTLLFPKIKESLGKFR